MCPPFCPSAPTFPALPFLLVERGCVSAPCKVERGCVSGKSRTGLREHPCKWKSYPPQHDPLLSAFLLDDGGTSLAGFSVKNPFGLRRKPMYAVGMTG